MIVKIFFLFFLIIQINTTGSGFSRIIKKKKKKEVQVFTFTVAWEDWYVEKIIKTRLACTEMSICLVPGTLPLSTIGPVASYKNK